MDLRGTLPIICLTATLVACGEEAHDSGGVGTCDLLGDASIVLAGPDIDGAPLILPDAGHVVDLVAGQAGYVQLKVSEGGLYGVLLDRRNVLRTVTFEGEAIDVPTGQPIGDCPETIPASYELDLPDAGLYMMKLGPVDADDVWLMVQTLGPSDSNPSH